VPEAHARGAEEDGDASQECVPECGAGVVGEDEDPGQDRRGE
jgi:hypothetical protein